MSRKDSNFFEYIRGIVFMRNRLCNVFTTGESWFDEELITGESRLSSSEATGMLTTVGSEKNFISVKYNREFRLHEVFITGESPGYW